MLVLLNLLVSEMIFCVSNGIKALLSQLFAQPVGFLWSPELSLGERKFLLVLLK